MAGEMTGREFIIGVRKATAWHTPLACAAGHGILILSDGVKVSIASEPDDSAGQPWIQEADAGLQTVAGNLEAYMRYEGFDTILALLMGTAGAPTRVDLTAAYANSYLLASKIDGLFATLAMKKLTSAVWEFPSVKINSIKISGEMNKPLKISIGLIGDKLDRASSVNTTTTIATITVPDAKNRIFMDKNTVFRMNDQSAIALADGDKIYPSSFELTFSRPMDSEPVAGQDGVDEPADNGFPVSTLMLKFPRYNEANNAFFSDWEAYTSKKIDITFTGATIEDTNKYLFRIVAPHLKIEDPEAPMSGPGKIPMSMKCTLMGASAAPAGMTALTAPLKIDVVNTRTTDPLA
ncbi:MAG: hypothetical protein KJ990_12510 [Proteobacteria bacterium]|nr:hypothetical protein [Pseudomonadota bacterium]MBU1648240.1 hypothetical protein [Pseudomonadota bacterium]